MGKMLRYQSQNLKQESSRKTGYVARYVLLGVLKNMMDKINWKKITDLASFKFDSEKLKKVDHKYNKVFAFVDWNNTDEKYAHKAGKSTFFKESCLNSRQLVENSPNENDTLFTPSPSVQTESKLTSVRNSTRQNLLYKSNQTKR